MPSTQYTTRLSYKGLSYMVTFAISDYSIGTYEFWGARYSAPRELVAEIIDCVPSNHTHELTEDEKSEAFEYWETNANKEIQEKHEI